MEGLQIDCQGGSPQDGAGGRQPPQFPGELWPGAGHGNQRWGCRCGQGGVLGALYLGHLVSCVPVTSDPEICPSVLPSPSFPQGLSGGCPSLALAGGTGAVCAHIYSLPQDALSTQQSEALCFLGSLAFQGRARHHHHNNDPIRNDISSPEESRLWEQALWVCSDTMRLVLFPFPL